MKANTLYVGGVRRRVNVDQRYAAFPCTVVLPDGRLFMVWREGSDHQASKDGNIVGAYSSDQGQTWTGKATLVDLPEDLRDPGIAVHDDGVGGTTLYLTYFKATTSLAGAGGFLRTSTDNGATWSAEVRVDALPYSALCSPVLPLSNGNLLAVFYGKADTTAESYDSIWASTSSDGGATWSTEVRMLNGATDGRDYQEPWAVETTPGTITVLYRWGNNDGIGKITSTNGGSTWSGAARLFSGTGRPSTVVLPSGGVVIVYRTMWGGGHGAARSSYDGLSSFTREQVVEPVNPDFWTYSGPVVIPGGQDLIFCPSAIEASTTSSMLSSRYLTNGSLETPFGDNAPDRSEVAASRLRGLVIWDDYDRPDSAYLGDTASGHNWKGPAGVTIKEGCAWDQGGTQVYLNYVNARTQHVDIEAEFAWSTNPGFGLIYRLKDESNYWLATIETGGTALNLYKIVNSAATKVGTATITAMANVWLRLRVTAQNDTHKVWLDGERLITATDSFQDTNTWVGHKMNSSSMSGAVHKCRSLVVRSLG